MTVAFYNSVLLGRRGLIRVFGAMWLAWLLSGVLLLVLFAGKQASNEGLSIARSIVRNATWHIADHVQLAGWKCWASICDVLVLIKRSQRGVSCWLQSLHACITLFFCLLERTLLRFAGWSFRWLCFALRQTGWSCRSWSLAVRHG